MRFSGWRGPDRSSSSPIVPSWSSSLTPRFGWEATVADAPQTQQTTSAVVEAAFEAQAPGIKRAAVIGGLASASGIALTATSGWLIVAASHQPVILTLLAVIVAVRTFGIARPVLRYAERVRSHDSARAAHPGAARATLTLRRPHDCG
jgi:hypothetical protein